MKIWKQMNIEWKFYLNKNIYFIQLSTASEIYSSLSGLSNKFGKEGRLTTLWEACKEFTNFFLE
jgi:hypothetical protein